LTLSSHQTTIVMITLLAGTLFATIPRRADRFRPQVGIGPGSVAFQLAF
jgi:hypothetical protein